MNEVAIIEKLRQLAARGARITLGIGDDCAIFRPRAGKDLLFKIDPMMEDVHFRRDQPPAIIGQRALARNLSDIAAMGGDAHFCLVSLALPRELGEKWIFAFYRGLLALATERIPAMFSTSPAASASLGTAPSTRAWLSEKPCAAAPLPASI